MWKMQAREGECWPKSFSITNERAGFANWLKFGISVSSYIMQIMLPSSQAFIRLSRMHTYISTYIYTKFIFIASGSINSSSTPQSWFLRLMIPEDNNAFISLLSLLTLEAESEIFCLKYLSVQTQNGESRCLSWLCNCNFWFPVESLCWMTCNFTGS